MVAELAVRAAAAVSAWVSTPALAVFVQRALFRPRGLFGRAYWYALAPFHRFIFRPLALGIERRALSAPSGQLS
jgi:hypothetical protein